MVICSSNRQSGRHVPTKTANLLTYWPQATDNAASTKTNCTSVDGATDPAMVSGTAARTHNDQFKRHADAIA